jgi:hypothetical protein
MITDKLYSVRIRKNFAIKTCYGRRIKYSRGQWIVGAFKKTSGGLMFLSEGIFFRKKRFDQLQNCEINLENDSDMAFQHLVEQYLHQKKQGRSNDNYYS